MTGRIRGVNLGNWLVLEKWMEPDLFDGTGAEDEIWLGRKLSKNQLEEKLTRHRDTYVTEADLQAIAAHGYNLVRIPVSFFIFGDREEGVGCISYLDQAFEWAKKYDLQILVDLHTVPGSQNGYDNGGLTGVCKWYKNPKEVAFVYTVLERIGERYASDPALFGIEVLNEPISFWVWVTSPSFGKAMNQEEAKGSWYVPMDFLKRFYTESYRRLRKILPVEKAVVFHDGFRMGSWNAFFDQAGMENVYLDTHIYIFAMENFVPIHTPAVYQTYMNIEAARIRRVSRHIPVIVGEWTLSNRYAVNEKDPEKQKERFREIQRMQEEAWNAGAGSIYWNYQLGRNPEEPMDEPWKESWALNRCWKNGWME